MPKTEGVGRRITVRRAAIVACGLLLAGIGAVSARPSPETAIAVPVAAPTEAKRQTDMAKRQTDMLRAAPESLLWIEMRNVTMHLDQRATLRVRWLRGQVRSTEDGAPAVLDDRDSFSIQVTGGSVALTGEDLTRLLNEFVFAYRGSPLKNLRARLEGEQVSLRGTMHKGVDLPFTISATMSLTPEGMIRLHPTRVRILGINGQALMRAIGLHLDDLLDLKGSRGATVRRDDIYLDPTKILPPPAIAGRLASARVDRGEVVIDFERTPQDSVFGVHVRPDSTVANFVYFRGAQLRFGKLLMYDTDLQIVDADPSDPFDLNLEEYARQLVAGTSRTLPNLGLRVEMPDYESLIADR